MKFEVNRPLVPMKAHYFMWNAGTGPVVPYLSVYARQLGFSSVVVGLIYTILPVFGMIAKPLFGAIADRFHCQKIIFLIAQLVTAAAFLAIFYSPKITLDNAVEFACETSGTSLRNLDGTTIDSELVYRIQSKSTSTSCLLNCGLSTGNFQTICSDWQLSQFCGSSMDDVGFVAQVPLAQTQIHSNSTATIVEFLVSNITYSSQTISPICPTNMISTVCTIQCEDEDINTLLTRTEISDSEAYGTYQFWVFLLLMITAWVGQAVAVSLGDAICFEMLGDKPNRYGYQRMFGALGWGVLSLLSGVFVDLLSENKTYTDYSISFYLAAGFLFIDFLVSSQLKYQQTKLSSNIIKDVGKLLVDIRILVFMSWCICVGMCTGLMWSFLLWMVEDLANARGETRIKTLQGVIMGVQCLGGELPFFFLSGRILKKIGHVYAMSLVLFTCGIRFVVYSLIDNPWYFIPIELSNGLTFGLFYACMASYASIIAPLGTEATMQGVVGAVFEGVGVSLGSFLAGLAMSKVSGSLTFRYFGFGALLACFVHVIVQHLLKSKDKLRVVARKPSFEKVRLEDLPELNSVEPLLILR